MKSPLVILLLLAALPALAQAPADKFVGTWEASVDGEPFVVLILQKKGDDIAGTIVQNDFDITEGGEISNIQPTHRKSRILSAEITPKALKITAQKNGQGENVRYLMENPQDGEAQLHMLIGGYGATKIAPLTLIKRAGK